MGHTKADDLKDLQGILNRVRSLEGIKEPKPNIFYFKSKPFLHFHDKEGKRWADVKDGETWGSPLDVPFDATQKEIQSAFQEIVRRFQRLL